MAGAGLPEKSEKLSLSSEAEAHPLAPVKWGVPPQDAPPPGVTVDSWENLVPPMKDPLELNDELLPPRGVFGGTMQDEIVGTTTDPYKAAHAAVYEQNPTYHPFPVAIPDALKQFIELDVPEGDPWMTGRAGNAFLPGRITPGWSTHVEPMDQQPPAPRLEAPSGGAVYGEKEYQGPPPLIPEPSVAKEIILPTLFDPQVMPDEKVGVDLSPYYFQTVPNHPLNIYNPYPVQQPPTIEDVMEKLT